MAAPVTAKTFKLQKVARAFRDQDAIVLLGRPPGSLELNEIRSRARRNGVKFSMVKVNQMRTTVAASAGPLFGGETWLATADTPAQLAKFAKEAELEKANLRTTAVKIGGYLLPTEYFNDWQSWDRNTMNMGFLSRLSAVRFQMLRAFFSRLTSIAAPKRVQEKLAAAATQPPPDASAQPDGAATAAPTPA